MEGPQNVFVLHTGSQLNTYEGDTSQDKSVERTHNRFIFTSTIVQINSEVYQRQVSLYLRTTEGYSQIETIWTVLTEVNSYIQYSWPEEPSYYPPPWGRYSVRI